MRMVTLTLLMLLTACILEVRTSSRYDNVPVIGTFFELQVLYHLAFEKHAYIQLEELYDLDKKTTAALRNNVIPADRVTLVHQWQHKLRSYIIFLLTLQPTDDNGVIKTEMSSLLLHQLRSENPEQIDLSYPNDDFYWSIRDGKVATTDASQEGVRKFFASFIKTTLAMTEETIAKYQSLFAFEPSTFAGLCYAAKYEGCDQLEIQYTVSRDTKTIERGKVTEMVNKTIKNLNIVIANIQRLEAEKDSYLKSDKMDSYEAQANAHYQKYELILLKAAEQGILPIFFTDIFKKTSGDIHLNISQNFKHTDNKLLTNVTSSTVMQAVSQLKKELLTNWSETKKVQRQRHKVSEDKIYMWIKNNDIAVARLLLQNPEYSPVVNYLFHKYEHEVDDRKIQKAIETVLITVGVGTLALFVTSFTPLLPLNAVLSKAIIISAMANFGWVGLNVGDSIIAHNRHLMVERALLSGTSQQVGENLKMLQEFEAARKNAILSGAIGLSMTASSYNQILKSLNSSSRPFLSNYIQYLFASRNNADNQTGIVIDP